MSNYELKNIIRKIWFLRKSGFCLLINCYNCNHFWVSNSHSVCYDYFNNYCRPVLPSLRFSNIKFIWFSLIFMEIFTQKVLADEF